MRKAIWIAGILASVVLAQDQPGPVVISGGRGGGIAVENGGLRVEGQLRLRLAGQTVDFLGGMIQGPVVKNAPYSAEAVTESTQKLFDGNEITKKTTAKQYRDSEGRERREEEMGATFITDPVAKVRLTLRPETKTAEQQPYGAPVGLTITDRFLDQAKVAVGRGGRGGPATAIITGNGSLKQEDLGTKTIEGITAQGTRSTRTIPAGEIGNTRPIEVVDERWYSPDLQITVMTRHSDPREGETVFQLKNVQRIEQIRSLFEAPSDYQVRSTGKTVFWTTAPGAR